MLIGLQNGPAEGGAYHQLGRNYDEGAYSTGRFTDALAARESVGVVDMLAICKAPLRSKSGVFATTPCRGLSLSR
jgi:hypothetical protein